MKKLINTIKAKKGLGTKSATNSTANSRMVPSGGTPCKMVGGHYC